MASHSIGEADYNPSSRAKRVVYGARVDLATERPARNGHIIIIENNIELTAGAFVTQQIKGTE